MIFARALVASIFAAAVLAGGSAAAQTYPDHPITLIVPFPPGGATDAIARIIQDPMQKSLGQPIVVENVGGAGPALVDLLSGEVDLESQSAVVSGPLVKAGKLKAYAIIGRNRFAGLPDLPTMGELGYKKLDIDFWHMLLAPAGTPRPIVDKINAALRTALADPKLIKTYAEGGIVEYPPDQETPEAAAALLKSEIKLWGDVVRDNHIAAAQ
jgi:tripartite-type tricarboxylate transporter receptor subunit TctC